MHLSSALVVSLSVAASAFLVPPNLPEDLKGLRWKGGPPKQLEEFIHSLLEQKTTAIDLACPGCPYAQGLGEEDDKFEREAIIWEKEVENVIHLEFDTHDHGLNVNGHALLPFEKAQHAQATIIKAYQIRKDNNQHSIEVPLNFAMEVLSPIPSPHKDEGSLIPVEFTVLGLNGVPVKVNTISFKLIRTPDNDLVIVRHEEIPFEGTPGAESCEGASPWSMCRLKAMIMSRIHKIKEAAKKKADKLNGWVEGKTGGCHRGEGPKSSGKHPHPPSVDGDHRYPHSHPHPHKQHGGHHKHHNSHRLGQLLHQTFRFFVIPALLGVIGGLAACAFGMLIGQAIVLLWFKNYRSGQRGPLRIVERDLIIENDEKDELLTEQYEAPPQYEDASKYGAAMLYELESEATPKKDEQH